MVDLATVYTGDPASSLHFLPLPEETLLVYPSADSVVILHASTLEFKRALCFWEAYPGRLESSNAISCLTTDPGMKLVVAASECRVAAWRLSETKKDTWRVHSSIRLADDQLVSSLDCQSGLLAVGSYSTLSVFTMALDHEMPTWTKKWTVRTTMSKCVGVRFSPSLTHLAAISPNDNTIRVFLTATGMPCQILKFPRPIARFDWRFSRSSSGKDDLILFAVTTDGTLRIYFPVVDAPHRLQLHAAIDVLSSTSLPSQCLAEPGCLSSIFWLEKDVGMDCFGSILSKASEQQQQDDGGIKRIRQLHNTGFDFVFRAHSDGSLTLTAVTNIDSRPPTLLDFINLLQLPANTLAKSNQRLYVVAGPPYTSMTLITSSPSLKAYNLDPLLFFNERPNSLRRIAHKEDDTEPDSRITRLIRALDGTSIAVLREDSVDAYSFDFKLRKKGRWTLSADNLVVFDGGKKIITYSDEASSLTLHPSSPLATLSIPRIISLYCVRSDAAMADILGITPDFSVVRVLVSKHNTPLPQLSMHSITKIPTKSQLVLLIPTRDTPWLGKRVVASDNQSTLLSVSSDGCLNFWEEDEDEISKWSCVGTMGTGDSRPLKLARCNQGKKTALINSTSEGEELSIWDSKESEFASGLELRHKFDTSEPVIDMDWTSTPDGQHILAVGCFAQIVLFCQQRMTYFDVQPAWGVCARIDIDMTPHSLRSSIWLSGGSLFVGAGFHIFQFGQPRKVLDIPASPHDDSKVPTNLLEVVQRRNGPLDHYHPQMILQCLLWGKLDLVRELIVKLDQDLDKAAESGHNSLHEWSLPIEQFLTTKASPAVRSGTHRPKRRYSLLWGNNMTEEPKDDEPRFTSELVHALIEKLEKHPLAHLTENEHANLIVLIETVLQVEEQRRALDENGLRYLISVRSFYILNQRAAASTPGGSNDAIMSGKRQRLRYRDMIWAFHSESQEILLSAASVACGGKMRWSDAKALGIFLWLQSVDAMKSQFEVIARNHYMADDARDPTKCCMYYFALGKVKLVHDLWKQAAWHPEQAKMLKFLGNDFSDPRWRTAALKNAYALLSRQRFEYATAFFLLGGGIKDACQLCIRQLKDFQLAVALARIVEKGDNGPVLKDILTNTVVPMAFETGNRWLGSWAFWLLRRRDLAVRILVTSLEGISNSFDIRITEIGDQNYDDPSLALLFSQLKSKTLQTIQGTSEIAGETEFRFVLQTARVFCKMGCHALALDLVKSWSFDRPISSRSQAMSTSESQDTIAPLPSPTMSRPTDYAFSPLTRRRSSILIDMDVPSVPTMRSAASSSTLLTANASRDVVTEEPVSEDPEPELEKKSFGSLMKSAKHDVQVPEFDMNSFW